MKKILMSGMIVASLFAIQLVQAATICDAKNALADARFNLMMMVDETDREEQDLLKTEIDTASTALEGVLESMLNDGNKNDDARLATCQKTWFQFKNTRETEIVPAIRKGDNAKAREIATGIQAKRMRVMNGVIRALHGEDCDL
jgi:hypothetical protein